MSHELCLTQLPVLSKPEGLIFYYVYELIAFVMKESYSIRRIVHAATFTNAGSAVLILDYACSSIIARSRFVYNRLHCQHEEYCSVYFYPEIFITEFRLVLQYYV